MNNEIWQKIMAVVRKTRDRIIIVDENDEAAVVMDFEQYRQLIEKNRGEEDLTDEELLDKINRDIGFSQLSDAARAVEKEKETTEEDDYYIEPV